MCCFFVDLCFYCDEPVTRKDNEIIKCKNCNIEINDDCYEKNKEIIEITNEEKEITELISFAKCPKCMQIGTLVVKIKL